MDRTVTVLIGSMLAVLAAIAALVGILVFRVNNMSAPANAPTVPVFQIVNGTPEYAVNIMLLNTHTGESWVNCRGEGGENGWCPMMQFTGAAVRKK